MDQSHRVFSGCGPVVRVVDKLCIFAAVAKDMYVLTGFSLGASLLYCCLFTMATFHFLSPTYFF